jgi:mono/diheme cytochrome c family protein
MTGSVPFGPAEVERLTVNADPWLSCDDCFEQVDQVIETALAASGTLPEPFRVHLTACAVCHEEARSLAALAAPDFGIFPEEGVRRLDLAIASGDA